MWPALHGSARARRALEGLVADDPAASARWTLLSLMIRRDPALNAVVEVQAPALLDRLLARDAPLLILEAHQDQRATTRVLLGRGRCYVRVGSNPGKYLRKAAALGGDTSLVRFVRRDEKTLLALRDALKERLPICCAVDFRGQGRRFEYVSPAIFAFAQRFDVPTVFAKSEVTEAGALRLHCRVPEGGGTPEDAARAFIAFFNATGGTRTPLEVRRFGT